MKWNEIKLNENHSKLLVQANDGTDLQLLTTLWIYNLYIVKMHMLSIKLIYKENILQANISGKYSLMLGSEERTDLSSSPLCLINSYKSKFYLTMKVAENRSCNVSLHHIKTLTQQM